MTPALITSLTTLLIDDQGAGLYSEAGQLLLRMPEAAPGEERRQLWASALREQVARGAEIQLLLEQSSLLVQCQDAPYLSVPEQRDVAVRVFAAESGDGTLASAATLDADPIADGGHVLWLAAHPKAEMADWLGAIQRAGCLPVYALPFQRALLAGMADLEEMPQDRVVLAVDPALVGHLCIFHGRSLVLERSFVLSEELSEAEEVIFEEVSRLLQFFKQKQRNLVFKAIQILGLPALSQGFQDRVKSSLRLEPHWLAPELWPVLLAGLRHERGRKDGLNLLPKEIRDAVQRRLFKTLVWTATAAMVTLFLVASAFLYSQEVLLEREVVRAAQLLAEREARTEEEERVVQARIPLLRERLAEQRQAKAMLGLARLGTAIFEPPPGIQLEQVEILEGAGDGLSHTFTVSGLAFTEASFSVGPLAQYLVALGRQAGVTLEPVKEVSISDRLEEGQAKLDKLAITRFTLKGSAK